MNRVDIDKIHTHVALFLLRFTMTRKKKRMTTRTSTRMSRDTRAMRGTERKEGRKGGRSLGRK